MGGSAAPTLAASPIGFKSLLLNVFIPLMLEVLEFGPGAAIFEPVDGE
jgi:hypothetical protein